MIFVGHFASPMRVSFPQFYVPDLLDLDDVVTTEDATRVTLQIITFSKAVIVQ